MAIIAISVITAMKATNAMHSYTACDVQYTHVLVL